jgi:hypothetical protein
VLGWDFPGEPDDACYLGYIGEQCSDSREWIDIDLCRGSIGVRGSDPELYKLHDYSGLFFGSRSDDGCIYVQMGIWVRRRGDELQRHREHLERGFVRGIYWRCNKLRRRRGVPQSSMPCWRR